ncbi:MAG: EamA family transporter, partial [Chthoniobacterales bacterium]
FGILMSLEPAVAALLGVVVLHELLSFRQWLAVALIIAASSGINPDLAPLRAYYRRRVRRRVAGSVIMR